MAQQVVAPPLVPGHRYKMSFEEFLTLDEDIRAEWVDGEVIVFMPPLYRHVFLASWLAAQFRTYLDLFELGQVFANELLVDLPATRSARMPDVTVVLQGGRARRTRHGVEGPPDLVVEFVSTDSTRRDRIEKRNVYAKAGIPEYIIAESREGRHQFEYLRLNGAGAYEPITPDQGARYHSEVIPGFWLDPNWFWQDPLPNVLELLRQVAPEALRRKVGIGEV
jgi:Uma2 family endonuclease